MKITLLLVSILVLTSCHNDDTFNPEHFIVTNETMASDDYGNTIFRTSINNTTVNTETVNVEVWYYSEDVYFQYIIEDVKLYPGETLVGGTTGQNGNVEYTISSVRITQ